MILTLVISLTFILFSFILRCQLTLSRIKTPKIIVMLLALKPPCLVLWFRVMVIF